MTPEQWEKVIDHVRRSLRTDIGTMTAYKKTSMNLLLVLVVRTMRHPVK